MDFPYKLKLEKPVQANGEEISELVFQEPTGKVLMNLPMAIDTHTQEIKPPSIDLASKLCNVPPSTIESLGYKDSLEVMKVVGPLCMDCLTTLG